MENAVILFLTSPSNWDRCLMSLTNFKQLEKLGYDIITLTTSDALPDYFYKKSKLVIHDYIDHKCEKKHYYDYFKKTGMGYFFWSANGYHKTTFFHETHFPSLLRNTRTLIESAKSFGYEKYFYIEDDHYIDEKDFHVVHKNLQILDSNDLVVYSFSRNGDGGNHVYCSYLHFGKCESMCNLSKNFAYTSFDFINSNPNIYMHFYEGVFKSLVDLYKPENFSVFIPNGIVSDNFSNSKLNMVYSYSNVIDDCRCNIIRNTVNNQNAFYFQTIGLSVDVNLKMFINKTLLVDKNMTPGSWFYLEIKDTDINNTEIVINDKHLKSFRNLNINDIIYNGEISY